jgi:hypothetical protein
MKATFNLLFAEGPGLPMANRGKTLPAARVPAVVEINALRFMGLFVVPEGWLEGFKAMGACSLTDRFHWQEAGWKILQRLMLRNLG